MTNSPKHSHRKIQYWIAIRLTELSLESLGLSTHDSHSVLVTDRFHIRGLSNDLKSKGLHVGMSSTKAQLMFTEEESLQLQVLTRSVEKELYVIRALSDKLYNYTPYIELHTTKDHFEHENYGLLLEVSQCIKLFKGFGALYTLITEAISQLKLSTQIGIAHTKHAAWLLSFHPESLDQVNLSQTSELPFSSKHIVTQQLMALDIRLLFDYKDTVQALEGMGFSKIGDIISHIEQQSLQSFRKRFGHEFCDFLTELLDTNDTLNQSSLFKRPNQVYTPEDIFRESIQLEYPSANCEFLIHPMEKLLYQLAKTLITTQQQTQSIRWCLYDIHHETFSMDVYFERLFHDIQIALSLSQTRLENQSLPFEVDTVELICDSLTPAAFNDTSSTPELLQGNSDHDSTQRTQQTKHAEQNTAHGQNNDAASSHHLHALAMTTAKIQARLGDNAMHTVIEKDAHIPELCFKQRGFDSSRVNQQHNKIRLSNSQQKTRSASVTHLTPNVQHLKQRPEWIFNTPSPIGKRQNNLYWKGHLELLQGPERIEGLWWKKNTSRDYFIAKRDDHVRLWIFFDSHKDEWFVHGVFS